MEDAVIDLEKTIYHFIKELDKLKEPDKEKKEIPIFYKNGSVSFLTVTIEDPAPPLRLVKKEED
jgi:hypothetical protein